MGDIILTGDLESVEVPDNDELYEVVNGQRVELPPMGAYDVDIASELLGWLRPYAKSKGLGRAVAEMLFALPAIGDYERRPDVAFVSYQRWPRSARVPRTAAWDVVPELAVEVVSPSNTANLVQGKMHDYFQAGVARVWVVYPLAEEVYVYSSPTQVRVLTRDDELDDETLLPGFRLPVRTLFDEGTETEPTP